jgi:hypothetical protein
LFCVYTDDLLVKLSICGAGCFIGTNIAGALAYDDDIVLLAPSPSAMRKLLAVCEFFALDCNIAFNASKFNYGLHCQLNMHCVSLALWSLHKVCAYTINIFNPIIV